jgi:competence protein ComFC
MLLKKGLLDFIYPALCLHCETENRDEESKVLCASCASLLSLLELEGRCRYCFTDHSLFYPTLCEHCAERESSLTCAASAIDYLGPGISLTKALKYRNSPHLAQGAAALMVAQFTRLQWPFPDLIVPVPIPWLRRLERGYNQSELLAIEMAKMLGCRWGDCLKRRSGDYSQAALSKEQRRRLTAEAFLLRNKQQLQGLTVLLVDDVLTTGTTLQRCAEVLQEALPKKIYALTLCKAQEM